MYSRQKLCTRLRTFVDVTAEVCGNELVPSTLSVQVYSVREQFGADPADALRRLAEIGFSRVEPYGLVEFAGVLAEQLPAHGLVAPTAHQRFLDTGLEPVLAAARQVGVGTVIDPFVEPERWQRAEDVEATAAALNSAAAVAADHGVRIGYHNHAHELAASIGGVSALEYFAEKLDERVVLELDTYWAVVGGADPVALLGRLGERIAAVHIKDGPGTSDVQEQVAVGAGTLPVAAIVAAAPAEAIKVVELDDTRGDMFTAVAESFAFLDGLGIS
jgi:sugar phosphate isomerase/epimerase